MYSKTMFALSLLGRMIDAELEKDNPDLPAIREALNEWDRLWTMVVKMG